MQNWNWMRGQKRRRLKKSLKYWIQNSRENTAVYQNSCISRTQNGNEAEGPTEAVANSALGIMENCHTEQSN